MNKNFQDETKHLNNTLNKIQEIKDTTKYNLEHLNVLYKNNVVVFNDLYETYNRRITLLNKIMSKPYFARLNFFNELDNKEEECYIGKVGISDDDNNLVTVDWRAPIATLYYDSNIGPCSYNAPGGVVNGKLLVKRHYEIEDGKLIDFLDVDTVSNDEILKPYLGATADNRLKNIVSTIQTEQNAIIRENINKNLIVQGVAGSGKTTVALHRIAYLVYNNKDIIKPEQYLVIGPNKFFVNYISGVLPDLDVERVGQLTYDEIVNKLLEKDFVLKSNDYKLKKDINDMELELDKYKQSLEFKNLIDQYIMEFEKNILPLDDFSLKGYTILSKNIIKNIYEDIKNDPVLVTDIIGKHFDKLYLFLSKYIKNNKNIIWGKVQHEFCKKITLLNKEEVKIEQKKIEFIKKELNNNSTQELKKYFSKSRPKIFSLYIDFWVNINKYNKDLSCNDKKIKELKKAIIDFEDLGALLYLYYRVYGSSNFFDYKHVVIDESQDFGLFNFYSLLKLMPNATFSIFGDLAQSIYSYRGINNWDEVIRNVFNEKCVVKYLNKSYRTTTEIMNEANNILKYINLNLAEPVIRHGKNVNYIKINNDKIDLIKSIIENYVNYTYNSIAIITKDDIEAKSIYLELKDEFKNINYIIDSDIEYKGGICILPSYLSKGLEFDGVVITDASSIKYNSNSDIDMKLLYVSMTRALHELNILYRNDLVEPLKK